MSYTHLSQDERYQIQPLRDGGFSLRECPMATINERMVAQIAAVPRLLGQLKARELARQMRADDRLRRRERRELVRRRSALGEAVMSAGCGDWSPAGGKFGGNFEKPKPKIIAVATFPDLV